MSNNGSFFTGLKCRECGRTYPKEPLYVCEYCFGPLEIEYDYDSIKSVLTKRVIASRPPSQWRYRELFPVDKEPAVGLHVGYTPLVRTDRLAHRLGVREVWVKDDTVNYPSLSFKDRVVSVAVSCAKEFGYTTIGCSSTGNLANSVAANAALAGLKSYVFVPADLEETKLMLSRIYGTKVISVNGTYDQINRLCSELIGQYNWAFVNINFRTYYTEGSKSMGFEIAEQLGWKLPDHVVVPMAGGSLITKIYKAFEEFKELGFIHDYPVRMHGVQAEGCSPIVNAIKDGTDVITPVEMPDTIVRSLAVGDPADGHYAVRTMMDSGGSGENPTDREVIEGMQMLAECEGIFSETAGGAVVSAAKRLIENGAIGTGDSVVLCITGNGLKTMETLKNQYAPQQYIQPSVEHFEEFIASNKEN